MNRRQALLNLGLAVPALSLANSALANTNWSTTVQRARGQQVFFNAWGGSEQINSYIAWAGDQLRARFDLDLMQVKITDTSEVVRRIQSEHAAGRHQGGSVDAIWVNGENFAALKRSGLLFGPFAADLPNFAYVDTEGKPTTLMDFSEPTDGLEAPWGMAQLTFFADKVDDPEPPSSMAKLLQWARANPRAFSYPAPPDFHGVTFVKQAALEQLPDSSILYSPADAAQAKQQLQPLKAFLDELHPLLWRSGKQFPSSHGQMLQMYADRELLISFSFNPNDAANRVASSQFADSTYAYQHQVGSIGNTHFIAIPYNSDNTAAAQVAINFLLSPEAQARKADINIWGDPTVLATAKLSEQQRGLFAAPETVPGSLLYPAPALLEPHASWVEVLEDFWLENYGV